MKTFLGNDKVLSLTEWETPASHYQEGQVGNFRLYSKAYTEGYYRHNAMDGYLLMYVEGSIPIMNLQEYRNGCWCDWMVDDPKNYRCMQKYAEAAEGKVLTTGLGLGLVAHELAKNEKVTSIVIVERSPEVIELVAKYIPEKCTVIQEDFWDFIEGDDTDWGMVIVDHWVFNTNKEQKRLYDTEAYPAWEKVKAKYPDSKLVFHGFWPITDVKLAKSYFDS